jgi:hypothetical protein
MRKFISYQLGRQQSFNTSKKHKFYASHIKKDNNLKEKNYIWVQTR